jgi:hypothetical protein
VASDVSSGADEKDGVDVSEVAADVATTRRANHRTSPDREKAPLCRAFPCAEEDSNLHPVNPDQALNPVV